MSKTIPSGIMHEPKTMVWAEATPLSEHKIREKEGIKAEVIQNESMPVGSRKGPLPLSRATTELRRAYPYIFDCAAYAKTHYPEKIETDLFYSRFTMPYKVFLEYCLDYCTEQTEYLKNEIYKIMKGQPAKYIKVSQERTVYAQPVVIAFSYTDLKTGKEKRIYNIGQDEKVDTVQIQILKELLDFSHGWINLPKAFFAKIRHVYNIMIENVQQIREVKDNYREAINRTKSLCNGPISTTMAAQFVQKILEQAKLLETLDPEQGGFYKIYLALEFILANKKRNKHIKNNPYQEYDFLELCEKCAPQYTQMKNGKLYLNNKNNEAFRYGLLICRFIQMFPESDRRIIGLKDIEMISGKNKEFVLKAEFFYFNTT